MIYEVQGGYYHNRENAYDAALELVTKYDLYEQFGYLVSYDKILDWCFQNKDFLEHFEEQIFNAEQNAVNEFYLEEIEFDDDEEEEEFKVKAEFLDKEEE